MKKMESGAGPSLAITVVVVGFVVVLISLFVAAYRISVHPGPNMEWPASITVAGLAIGFAGFVLGLFEWIGNGLRIKVRTGFHSGPSPYVRGGLPMWVNTEDAERDVPPAA